MTTYIKSKKFSQSKYSQGLAILSILITFSIFCLGFFYLIQTNSLIECSYQIRQQKKEVNELKLKSQQLELAVASWQSPVNLEEMIQSLNMIEGGEVVYLEEETIVAVKE